MVGDINQTQPADYSGSRELHSQVALVTGASRGIGRAIAIELAKAGAALIVHGCSNRDGVEETARRVRECGQSAWTTFCDLADESSLEGWVEQAWGLRERVDIWVNNAGADVLTGEPARWTFEAKLDRLWQVDVRGTVLLSRMVGAKMFHQGAGTIINVGWDQVEHGMAGDAGQMFAASKGAIMAFTRSLAQTLAPQVRVNCVAPGWIKTAWGENAADYWQERACRESLLGRWGTPEDVAQAVRFLASPSASFVTGHILPVNGGFRASST